VNSDTKPVLVFRGPNGEPVDGVAWGRWRDVSDFVLPSPDLHGRPVVRIDKDVVTEGTDAEQKSCQSVEGEHEECEERGSEFFSRP